MKSKSIIRRENIMKGKSLEGLYPCPWCKTMAEVDEVNTNNGKKWYVYCPNIDCAVKPLSVGYDNIEGAIRVWNRYKD